MSEDELRERIIEALRDGTRNDSAADAVEFVSEVVGFEADQDPILKAEREEKP